MQRDKKVCGQCKHIFREGPGRDTWDYCKQSEVEVYGKKVYKAILGNYRACEFFEPREEVKK